MLEREQIDFLLVNAYNAALRAGEKVMDIYLNSKEFNVNIKSDNSPITEADRQAHNIIKSYLGQTRIPLLSEEGRNLLYEERCGWDLFWLVDPLDGTKEFIKRNGEFTINIALMINNEPFLGIVYVPVLRKIYFGDMDRGSFLKVGVAPDKDAEQTISQIFDNVQRLPLAENVNTPVRIAVSRSHISAETYQFIDDMKKEYGEIEVVKQGSSLKLCMIAEGTIDLYARTTSTFEWDTAAGQSIIKSAGASITNFENGQQLQYNKENLTNPFFLCRSKFIKDKQ